MGESEKLKKVFEKNNKDKYDEYQDFICYIKQYYRDTLKDDLNKIDIEKKRLNLEIECSKNPSVGYIITISIFSIGMLTSNILSSFEGDSKIAIAIVHSLVVLIVLGMYIVNYDRKINSNIYALQGLKELEEEIKNNKGSESTQTN
ncbi:hypothetical protein KQI36_14470 [Clostridium senegalense]|uniref:hypothetical protein n=1 Tax=Clostridium senegalense TaxID=1465809 RepID=UPI001C11CE82|nr:hypothetical protein [Clostridium senegalense]MBU5227837.1 hypothetical protein [Clostridium senegalense]